MASAFGKLVPKNLILREEDYWVIGVNFLSFVLIGFGLYASVPIYRLPLLFLGLLSLWPTSSSLSKGYNAKHAVANLTLVLFLALVFLVCTVLLTN